MVPLELVAFGGSCLCMHGGTTSVPVSVSGHGCICCVTACSRQAQCAHSVRELSSFIMHNLDRISSTAPCCLSASFDVAPQALFVCRDV